MTGADLTATPPKTPTAPRIRALEGVLSNQIAAGEVIERPASVVKELIENCLDAAARRVDVEVACGGVQLVRVQDDGCGIHSDDLELALSRHATSKIATLADLERVSSLGFRGEALPSIASVSRFSLASRMAESETGFEVVAEGGAAGAVCPAAVPPGTVVSVRDLFFNTPARRKFLRTERTEYRHVEDVVKRAALSRFDVAFSLKNNGREVFRLGPATDAAARQRRVGRLLGQAFAQEAVLVEFEGPGMVLRGWVSGPDAARAHSDGQYFFINGRAVRDSTARHAVRLAFGERLAGGRHPAYVLYLDLDPTQVDVNVHPAKHEVRFRETRLVHDFIWRSLARALEQALALPVAHRSEPGREHAQAWSTERRARGLSLHAAGAGAALQSDDGVLSGTAQPSPTDVRLREEPAGAYPLAPADIVAGRYAVVVRAGDLVIVDLAETRRAVISAALGRAQARGDGASRPLLLPTTFNVAKAEADRLEDRLDALSHAGFDLRRTAPTAMSLRAVPACLAHVPVQALIRVLVAWSGKSADACMDALAETLARLGAEHLEDLASNPQSVAGLLRFLETQPRGSVGPDLVLSLDATAIAALMRR